MSKFRRLIMQANAESENPNLAIITDHTTQVNSLTARTAYPAGVTANLKPGIQYRVRFKVTVACDESSGNTDVYITHKWPNSHWSKVPFIRILKTMSPGQKITKEVDMINSVRNPVDSNSLYLFTIDASKIRGSIRVFDLMITEV